MNHDTTAAKELWQALKELVDETAQQMDEEDNPVWRYCKLKLLQYSQYQSIEDANATE